jgi:spore maturation protein A
MMNYLWASLILISFLFAIGTDLSDLRNNTYRNGLPLVVQVEWPPPAATADPAERVTVTIPHSSWPLFFDRERSKADEEPLEAIIVRAGSQAQLHFTTPALPAPLAGARAFHDPDNKVLVAQVLDRLDPPIGAQAVRTVSLRFEPVRFVKLKAINDAAVSFAQRAFEVALGLTGGLALWLGLLKIADDAGLVNLLVRAIQPLLRPLFPDVPRDSPALGLIALNVAANMLALGNAATPIGIKAMQELQKLNPTKDTATNAMVMLLAINTAGVTLLPSPSLVGIMGPRIGAVMGPILLTTAVALAIAVVACKLLERKQPTPEPEATV